MHVKAVIMNHDNRGSTNKLYHKLSSEFDVSVFDSGSKNEERSDYTTHVFPNVFWTGCWNHAMSLFKCFDVIWY